MVQGLGLGTFMAVDRVQPLAGELRSCKPCDMAKKNPKSPCIELSGARREGWWLEITLGDLADHIKDTRL